MADPADPAPPTPDPEAPPPFLGTWRRVYTVVVVELFATIAIFAALRWCPSHSVEHNFELLD